MLCHSNNPNKRFWWICGFCMCALISKNVLVFFSPLLISSQMVWCLKGIRCTKDEAPFNLNLGTFSNYSVCVRMFDTQKANQATENETRWNPDILAEHIKKHDQFITFVEVWSGRECWLCKSNKCHAERTNSRDIRWNRSAATTKPQSILPFRITSLG